MTSQTTASPMFKTLTGGWSRRVFAPLMRGRTPIFMLHRRHDATHGIHGHTAEFIRASLTALRDCGAKFVSLRTVVETWRTGQPVDPNWVVFTMDDGFADQAELVREAFAPLNCPVTMFLITGFVDNKLWPWDDQLAVVFQTAARTHAQIRLGDRSFNLDLSSPALRMEALDTVRDHCKTVKGLDTYAAAEELAAVLGTAIPRHPPAGFQPITWSTARALEREGLCDFGPHSVAHRIFSCVSDSQARSEMEESWKRLKQELSRPLSIFAWPTGRPRDFTQRDMELAQQLGLHGSVSTNPDYAYRRSSDPAELFRISRFAMPEDINMVLRYGSWLERARQLIAV